MKQLLWALVLALGVTGTMLAQDDDSYECSSALTDADCLILQTNYRTMQALNSFAIAFDGHLTFEDLPDIDGVIRFAWAANGEVMGDWGAFNLSPEEAEAVSTDREANAMNAIRMVEAVEFRLNAVLKMPEPLVEFYGGDLSRSIPLNLVLVDGNLYMDMTSLRDALGRDGRSLPQGWWGINMTEAILLDLQTGRPNPTPPRNVDPDLLDGFEDVDFDQQFVMDERLADDIAAEGTPLAVFRTTLDFASFWDIAEVRELIFQSLELQGNIRSRQDRDDMSLLLTALFENMTLDVTTSIDLNDYYTHSVKASMAVDLGPVLRLMSILEGDPGLRANTTLLMEMTWAQSRFNEIERIEAPPGATLVPLDLFSPVGPPLQAKRAA